jgi:crossover junction endodeoxyribonuclease RuvC
MSTVAGLDLSLTNAGVAVLADGRPRLIKSIGHHTRDGASYAQRNRRIVSQARAVTGILKAFGVEKIDFAVIEGPLPHEPSQAYAWDRAQLWGGVFSQLLAWKIPTAVINPMTLKLWFTGAGNATKTRMLDTARGMFREAIASHDEADAIALATLGAYRLGDPIPFKPNERQLLALEKVEWPEVVVA